MDRSTDGDDQPGLIARYGQLYDSELPEQRRTAELTDLLVDVLAESGVQARRAEPVLGSYPAVGLQVAGVAYLVVVTWLAEPAQPTLLREVRQAAAGRPGVRVGLLSMSGFTAVATDTSPGDEQVVVLLNGIHVEAALCGLASGATMLGEMWQLAVFGPVTYVGLTELLIDDGVARPAPPGFVTPDRKPAPWDLCKRAANGVGVRHLFSGEEGWNQPLGFAVVDADRMLVTTDQGIIQVDARRGTTHWLLPLTGCWGDPLPRPDGSVLTLCGQAVVEWKDGVLTPIAGDLGDARALLVGPGGDPWALSGYGARAGSDTATLALTRLGHRAGQQQRHPVVFPADVRTAGWLGDLRFYLAAAGHSAVVDLARSSRVRREDWIETPHHSPDHLVVAGPQTVITASPDRRGVHATVYRTDATTGISELLAEITTNRVHGLAVAGSSGGTLLMLGDVRGNDVRIPHPVIAAITHAASATASETPGTNGAPASIQPSTAAVPAPRQPTPVAEASDRSATAATTPTHTVDPYAAVRLAAHGVKRDYALDSRPIARGGQAEVFGAVHKLTQLRVAFKRLTVHGPDQIARMKREIEAGEQFGGHPHVMPVLDFSTAHDWFVMPLADDSAQTQAADLTNQNRLREMITAVCEALREPHETGWIHRDLKPDNILAYDGRWVVADWGLGRRPRGQTTDPRRTRTGSPFGTEDFAAPELGIDAHGVGPQADIYSIGQIIGWALTQTWPRANVPLLPPAGPWRAVVKAATNLEPDRRPHSVDELLTLIAEELDEPPDLPINQGKTLLAAAAAGDQAAPARLWRLAARPPADYELYLQVLVDLDDEQTTGAVTTDPTIARDVVRGVHELHADSVTLEYADVQRLVAWLLVIAYHAECIEEWDLLEDAVDAIFYLDGGWDQWNVQRNIRDWLATRSGHAASVAAAALRRNPDARAHFDDLASNAKADYRIRAAARPTT